MGLPATSILHLSLALLMGFYAGISLSGLQHVPSQADNPSILRTSSSATSLKNKDSELDIRELEKAKLELEQWKTTAMTLQKDHASSLNKLHDLEASCSESHHHDTVTSSEHQNHATTSQTNPHPVCQVALRSPTPSAMALWNQHMVHILDATRVPTDRKWQFHDFTAQLLQIVSPRLPRSVKTIPYDWRPVDEALMIAWERYQYLHLPKAERLQISYPPRPLKILIMGGSLLVGTNCRNLMKELNFQFQLPKRACTWSNRLGLFLNYFFHASEMEPLVEVTKVAMGGTNTATGSVIWQYDLIPPEARNPDIVINAYSTNDMHILTILEAQSSNTTLRDRIFDMTQSYVRQILQTRHCPDIQGSRNENKIEEPISPLLLHVDDYLGNEQRKIWETTELSQGVQVLASYYGFASMSYADVVRDLVYGDTYETWFSSAWWKKTKNLFAFEREIHPGMGMHIASTWVTAFNLLHLASTFCSYPTPYRPQNGANYEAGLWGLPELRRNEKEPEGKPRPQPKGLPPPLTKNLLLEDVTALWKERAEKAGPSISCSDNNHKETAGTTLRVKCPFSWVSGLSLQQNNVTWVQEYFQRQSSVWKGWQLSDDKDKIGFVPIPGLSQTGNMTRMVLDFKIAQPIESVTWFFMKSYGPKWRDSQLEAKVWRPSSQQEAEGTLLEERHLFGVHNKSTSEMYTEEMILKDPVLAGEKFQVEATLVGGYTFKIMGLAVCS